MQQLFAFIFFNRIAGISKTQSVSKTLSIVPQQYSLLLVGIYFFFAKQNKEVQYIFSSFKAREEVGVIKRIKDIHEKNFLFKLHN